MKFVYFLGFGYLAYCLYILFSSTGALPAPSPSPRVVPPTISGNEWFNQMKPFCNSVEVTTRIASLPPPETPQGSAYAAACYALAGEITKARQTINGLSKTEQSNAASIVFNIGHPVADAGDDKSAGPIMELVLEYQPANFMALYHAGMSEYILGEREKARINLTRFLELYKPNDGWRQNAIQVLQKIDQ